MNHSRPNATVEEQHQRDGRLAPPVGGQRQGRDRGETEQGGWSEPAPARGGEELGAGQGQDDERPGPWWPGRPEWKQDQRQRRRWPGPRTRPWGRRARPAAAARRRGVDPPAADRPDRGEPPRRGAPRRPRRPRPTPPDPATHPRRAVGGAGGRAGSLGDADRVVEASRGRARWAGRPAGRSRSSKVRNSSSVGRSVVSRAPRLATSSWSPIRPATAGVVALVPVGGLVAPAGTLVGERGPAGVVVGVVVDRR